MKVCQVLGGKGEGGLEKHVSELSNALKERNIDVTVIANKKFLPLFKNVNFIPLDLTRSRMNIFILYKLYKIIKKGNFNIVHCHANKSTYMMTIIKPFINSKVVATLHNYKKKLKKFNKCDFVITVSDKIAENLELKNKKTIYNGLIQEKIEKIDLNEKFNIPKDKFIICGVGRFAHQKRFDVLISSLIYFKDVHLILIGNGEDEKKLISLSKKLNVYENITFTGMVPNQYSKSIMASSNLFVLTSDREGFGYVFAESLLAKTPIISTDVADIKKFIGEEYIFPFNNPKELAQKIKNVKENYESILIDFQNIFDLAENKFTVNKMSEETIEIYKKVIDGH